ncbi:MAG: hypothetical protein K1X71_11635 [Pirellulales bacterium]|nr:hypothetical protein [Pirellulales bacterium]
MSLLAALYPWQSAMSRVSGDHSAPGASSAAALFAVLTVAGLILAGLGWLVFGYVQQRRRHSTRGLFLALCQLHGLGAPQRRVLQELARQGDLNEPAHLFLAPERFDARQLPADFAARHGAELRALQARLFP